MANSFVTVGGVEPNPARQPQPEPPKDTRVVMYRHAAGEPGWEAREFRSPENVPAGEGWVDHPAKVTAPTPAKVKAPTTEE